MVHFIERYRMWYEIAEVLVGPIFDPCAGGGGMPLILHAGVMKQLTSHHCGAGTEHAGGGGGWRDSHAGYR